MVLCNLYRKYNNITYVYSTMNLAGVGEGGVLVLLEYSSRPMKKLQNYDVKVFYSF